MKRIETSISKLTTQQIEILKSTSLKDGFTFSHTNGGFFSSYIGDMQYYTDEDWSQIDHLTEVEVTEHQETKNIGDRQALQGFGTCYFIDAKALKQLAL
jgi:hypothetical protein